MCPKKLYSALKIASSSVARAYLTANDPSKSDQARAAASDLDADGKQSAKLLRNISLLCTSLVYAGETCSGKEKRHYLHLWARLTRCMAGEFYSKYLYQIHQDELFADWIGELHNKKTLYCGFSFLQTHLVTIGCNHSSC